MIVPPEERGLGVFSDDYSSVREFSIPRKSMRDIDPSDLTFRLDFMYKDGTKNVTVLEKIIFDDEVKLTWNIIAEDLRVEGTVLLQVHGNGLNGTVRWASYMEPFYIGNAIDTAGSYTGELSALEALLTRVQIVENAEQDRIVSEQQRKAGETTRVSSENERIANEDIRIVNESDRQSSINDIETRFHNLTTSQQQDAEVIIARGDKASLGQRLDGMEGDFSSQLADYASQFNSKTENETAALSAELVDATGWVTEGWTGDFANGFTHTTGNTAALKRSMTTSADRYYIVEFDTSAPLDSNDLFVSIGGSQNFDLYIGTVNHYSAGVKTVSSGDLLFIPKSTLTIKISNISVKEVIGVYDPTLHIKDSGELNAFEIRATKKELQNIFVGVDSGSQNISGYGNVALGADSLKDNTSGFWNAALGLSALKNNVGGSRNIGIGFNSLSANISGHRNVAIGTFALQVNTIGDRNISIGADTMFANTSGSENIAIGFSALGKNTTGNNNIAIGLFAGNGNTTGNNNIAIGRTALSNTKTGEYNIAIGYDAGSGKSAGSDISFCIFIGQGAGGNILTGADNNVMIGYESGYQQGTGKDNTYIGYRAGKGAGAHNCSNNVLIGSNTGRSVITGADNNVMIGAYVGSNLKTGSGNILIGYNINTPSETTSNELNIGNLIKGNLLTKILVLDSLPTANPNIKGAIWSNSGVLTVSAG